MIVFYLFLLCFSLRGRMLMTFENVPPIVVLQKANRITCFRMTAYIHYNMAEYFEWTLLSVDFHFDFCFIIWFSG